MVKYVSPMEVVSGHVPKSAGAVQLAGCGPSETGPIGPLSVHLLRDAPHEELAELLR